MGKPRSVVSRDGSVQVFRSVPRADDPHDTVVEQFYVPEWVASSLRAAAQRCHCVNPCAGGCKHPRIGICPLCLNGIHDPNPARDFVENRTTTKEENTK